MMGLPIGSLFLPCMEAEIKGLLPLIIDAMARHIIEENAKSIARWSIKIQKRKPSICGIDDMGRNKVHQMAKFHCQSYNSSFGGCNVHLLYTDRQTKMSTTKSLQ